MEIPRFERLTIDRRRIGGDIGDAFQTFVHDALLGDYPKLHRFPGGGKDGGIDLIDSTSGLVVECKVAADFSEAESRWRKVQRHLDMHLRDAAGPTLGQSQYRPWYVGNPPIRKYVFVVSAVFANEQQRRDLSDQIANFFRSAAVARSHLSHLSGINVSVVDWSDLTDVLRRRPHLIFRWFPSSRPSGLLPLDDVPDLGTFRSYLNSAKLPYHSLAEHLLNSPVDSKVPITDEQHLLEYLARPEITGLVILGKGGVGKSRLTIELGRVALANGWSVMKVYGKLKDNALDAFAATLGVATPGLLLVDYIEMQTDFGQVVENLNVLNDSGVARLYYIAACRTGYYHRAIAASRRHVPVDRTPPVGEATVGWFSEYRRQTVRLILEKSGVAVTDKHLKVCHDVPVLAVFVAYLHASGRRDDLEELLNEAEFGQWVARRVQSSFPNCDVSRDLARLVVLFPLPDAVASSRTFAYYRPMFDALATDGWIEKAQEHAKDEPRKWVIAHDVLADQILVSYARRIPDTVEHFISEVFKCAAELGELDSPIIAFQRLADVAPLKTIQWRQIFAAIIPAHEKAWQQVRHLLLGTPLLTPPERIALLRAHPRIWIGAEEDSNIQKRLGWLARWVVTEQHVLPDLDKDEFEAWIGKACHRADKSNFVLTWGLYLAPAALRQPALHWITNRPAVFQTHYLLVAWLKAGLEPDVVKRSVGRWCAKYADRFHLSFVVVAWLNAGGDISVVENAVRVWLGGYKVDMNAQHLYQAWLKARGDQYVIRAAMSDWLAQHASSESAIHVYKTWLEAEGSKPEVVQAVLTWLTEYYRSPKAGILLSAWLGCGGNKDAIAKFITLWMDEHAESFDAEFLLTQWLNVGGDLDVVRQPLQKWIAKWPEEPSASYVIGAWVTRRGDTAIVENAVVLWLQAHGRKLEASYLYKSWLAARGDKRVVEESMKGWLSDHYTHEDAQYVFNLWLDANGDRIVVRTAVEGWLAHHPSHDKTSHVFKAWLDCGGEVEVVRSALIRWLEVHGDDDDADFVFRAWLNAGGDWRSIGDYVIAWFSRNKSQENANYLLKSIVRQPNLPVATIKEVFEWCRSFADNADAMWRFTGLGKHLFTDGLEWDVLNTAEALLKPHLSHTARPNSLAQSQIVAVISFLVELSNSQRSTVRDGVDALFVSWIRHPRSFGGASKPHVALQRVSFVSRFALLVHAGFLDVNRDKSALRRYVQWLNAWEPKWKQRIATLVAELRESHPAPSVWQVFDV